MKILGMNDSLTDLVNKLELLAEVSNKSPRVDPEHHIAWEAAKNIRSIHEDRERFRVEIEQLHEAIDWLSNDSDPEGPCWCPKGMSKDGKPFPHTSQCEEIRSLLTKDRSSNE